MEKLPEDFKKKWLEALRSGEYKQGTGFLYEANEDRYCCLGVACRVAGNPYPIIDCDFVEYPSGKNLNIPPILVSINEVTKTLSDMNDGLNDDYSGSSKSFSEIADWIEKNL